jgi:hypothetical protein
LGSWNMVESFGEVKLSGFEKTSLTMSAIEIENTRKYLLAALEREFGKLVKSSDSRKENIGFEKEIFGLIHSWEAL